MDWNREIPGWGGSRFPAPPKAGGTQQRGAAAAEKGDRRKEMEEEHSVLKFFSMEGPTCQRVFCPTRRAAEPM